MSVKKSNALKGIVVPPIELTVDEAMAYLPATLDLADPTKRQLFRDWMVRVCGLVAKNNAEAFGRATMAAIDEAAALMINPRYRDEQNKRRANNRARRAATLQAQKHEQLPKAVREFNSISETKLRM